MQPDYLGHYPTREVKKKALDTPYPKSSLMLESVSTLLLQAFSLRFTELSGGVSA